MRDKGEYLFTSESVSEGHPDKVADRISDTVLDAFLEADPYARVACETLVTTNRIVLAGETRGPASVTHELLAHLAQAYPRLRHLEIHRYRLNRRDRVPHVRASVFFARFMSDCHHSFISLARWLQSRRFALYV